jgi:hypothetical protein
MSSPMRSFHKIQARKNKLGVQESIIPHKSACQFDMNTSCRHLNAMLLTLYRFGKYNVFCSATLNHREELIGARCGGGFAWV